MDIKNFFQSKMFTRILYGIAGLIVVLGIFQVGLFVGYHKASFSYRMGENYYRTFGDHRRGPLKNMMHADISDAHGVSGTIIKVDAQTIVIEGRDNVEKVVLVSKDTLIRRFRDDLKISDLKLNDTVVIIGSPNDQSQIEAKLIRVLPVMPSPSMEQIPSAQ